MNAVAETIEQPSLRAQYAERIKAAWHKSRERILALGNALLEAKRALSPEDFTAMLDTDLPFGADQARRFIRIAADPRLARRETSHMLPETLDAMDTLQRLNDEQFEAAMASGRIHDKLTVKESRELVKQYLAPAPYDITQKPHRPEASKCGPPVPPNDIERARRVIREFAGLCLSWPEMLWLLIDLRKSIPGQYEGNCVSQVDLDQRVGWADGMISHYETPHDPQYGRVPTAPNLLAWLQALAVR